MHGERLLIELLVESSSDGIAALDRDTNYTIWNPAMERITGIPGDKALGRTVLEVFPRLDEESLYEPVTRALAGEVVRLEDYRYTVPSRGRPGFYEVIISPIVEDGDVVGVLSAMREITQRKELEEQLRHAHRMEATGQLAGGVAHDFNNLLTAIRGFSELLTARLGPDAVGLRYAAEVTKAADQGAALVRQLLAFARREMAQPRELDLNTALADAEEVLRRLTGDSIQLAVLPRAASGWVLADPGEIEQIFLTLALNARDAMPRGGALVIETSNEDGQVVLSVSDSGVGMDADTLAHALEPFFTTKPVGHGTGLGLATVYGIVERSGGQIRLESEPGRGTTVLVALPQVETPAEAKPAREPLPGDTATILLVDDAPSVRSVSRAMLEGAGYQVLEASDGSSALELVRERGDHLDLVVSDVVMPGMSGRELAASIADLRPGMPVVLMSGYTEIFTDEPEGLLLRKPYTREALLARVGAELGPSPSAGPMTCLVADDHPSVLVAISGALAAHGFEVVAEAQNGRDALAVMGTRRPAIAVVDARMPELDGIELARSAARVAPETAVIVYSAFAERPLVDRALASGARGFVLKGAPLAELVRAVEVVAAGGTYIDPHVAGLRPMPDAPTLTPREEQVLGLAADGMTNNEIAARLSISSETVQTHVRKAMTKLEAESRTQAVAKALRSSLIP